MKKTFIFHRPMRPMRPNDAKKLDAFGRIGRIGRKKQLIFFDMNTENYKYRLAKWGKDYRKKQICPQCSKLSFVPYISNDTNELAGEQYGKCDRADNCGYTKYPKSECTSFDDWKMQVHTKPIQPQPKRQISFIDNDIFKKSLAGYDKNVLIKYLSGVAGTEKVMQAVRKYNVETTKDGATIFWQIDGNNRIRAGKIMHYKADGHRDHDVKPPVQWVHSTLKLPDYNLVQCLFGENLLRDTTKKVAIVEGEKTAVVASLFLPDYIWLATGGEQNFGLIERCAALKGKKIMLFPDLKAFDDWKLKADKLKNKLDISVFDVLERKATEQERAAGWDIADYLLMQVQKVETTITPETTPITAIPTPTEVVKEHHPTQNSGYDKMEKHENWNIAEIENYFSNIELTTEPVRLNQCSMITDVYSFIQSHLATVKANNGKQAFLPYLCRLQELKQIFINLNTLTI
jgi:hypothetical protein